VARGGFHASNGHRAVFYFGREKNCHFRCFDEAWQQRQASALPQEMLVIPTDACDLADRLFSILCGSS
jgi:hypothetical protein